MKFRYDPNHRAEINGLKFFDEYLFTERVLNIEVEYSFDSDYLMEEKQDVFLFVVEDIKITPKDNKQVSEHLRSAVVEYLHNNPKIVDPYLFQAINI
jgi:hypothetical protein